MIHFNVDKVFNDAAEYIYSDEKKPLADDVEYLYERLCNMEYEYTHGEVSKVINAINLSVDDEEEQENIKAIKGVKSADIAWIASHFGFFTVCFTL